MMGSKMVQDPKARIAFVGPYVPDMEEERKLVRKIDLHILPTMWLMYLLSYMDRTKSAPPTSVSVI